MSAESARSAPQWVRCPGQGCHSNQPIAPETAALGGVVECEQCGRDIAVGRGVSR